MLQAVETSLAVRRAADCKLEAVERSLRSVAPLATAQGDTHVVTHTAIAWAEQGASDPQRHNRLSVVVRCARLSHAEDPRHEVPPGRLFYGQRRRRAPDLLRAEDLQALLAQAARLGPPDALRPPTSRPLLGLLAVTGLRISEALALRCKDVTPDGLGIRETQFRKSRLVPLQATATSALQGSWAQRGALALDADHVCVSGRRRPLSDVPVVATFHQLLTAAGLPTDPERPRPRLMDLRHPLASRALETCPDGRDRLGRHLLALTTYMGHARVKSTSWYVSSPPPLRGHIAQAWEAFVQEQNA